MKELMWKFETANFVVRAYIEPDTDTDISFDETNETRDKLASGEWYAFATKVCVSYRGAEIGADYLGGSIYANPREFFSGHRDANPMNRNCSAMRAAHGGEMCIGYYFPDMVRNAISEARKTLADMPRLRHG